MNNTYLNRFIRNINRNSTSS